MACTKDLTNALDAALAAAKFSVAGFVELNADAYRLGYETSRRWSPRQLRPSWYEAASVRLPTKDQQRLDGVLAKAMVEHMDDQSRMGVATTRVTSGFTPMSADNLRCGAVVSAALFGARQTAETLLGWAAGEPVHYTTTNTLEGASVEETLELHEEVRLIRFPNRAEELSQLIPEDLMAATVYAAPSEPTLSDATALRREWTVGPVFCRPDKDGLPTREPDIVSTLPEKFWTLILTALSLACDSRVIVTRHWTEASDGCTRVILGISKDRGRGLLNAGAARSAGRPSMLTRACVERALGFVERLRRREDRLHIAISRWMNSKRWASVEDQLVDVRIALEALYAQDASGEVSLRVALRGAWHLGADVDGRQEHFGLLRDLYGRASKVAHAKRLKPKPRERDNQSLLADARAACRDGILKILDEGEPDWTTLWLGGTK